MIAELGVGLGATSLLSVALFFIYQINKSNCNMQVGDSKISFSLDDLGEAKEILKGKDATNILVELREEVKQSLKKIAQKKKGEVEV